MNKFDKLEGLTWDDVVGLKKLWEEREKEKFSDLDSDGIYEIDGRYFIYDYSTIDSKTGNGQVRVLRLNEDMRYTVASTNNKNVDSLYVTYEELDRVKKADFKPLEEIYQLENQLSGLEDVAMTKGEFENNKRDIESKIVKVVRKCPHKFKERSYWGANEENYTCELCGYEVTKCGDDIVNRNILGIKVY